MIDSDGMNSHIVCRATKRLTKELNIITKSPIPGIDISVNEDNILEWHFVIHGNENTPYYGGMYHGKFIFPSDYPYRPPQILFLTPNGRFKTDERICFSLSDFHPEEWKPAFSITTVLQGVKDFMHDSTETIGSIETSESVKRQLAKTSTTFNAKNFIFRHLFPQLCERIQIAPTYGEDVENSRSQGEVKNASFIRKFRKGIKRNIINNAIGFLLVCLILSLCLPLLALFFTLTGISGINLRTVLYNDPLYAIYFIFVDVFSS